MGLDEELLARLGEDACPCLEWIRLIEDFSGSVELKRFEEFMLLLSWNILIRDCWLSVSVGLGFDGPVILASEGRILGDLESCLETNFEKNLVFKIQRAEVWNLI